MMYLKKTLVVVALLFAGSLQLLGQPGNPQDDPDDAVPITGIEWLIVGGCALGMRKLFASKKDAIKE